jgi:hypothetical protein
MPKPAGKKSFYIVPLEESIFFTSESTFAIQLLSKRSIEPFRA